jgi:hypothetical protein
LTSVPHLTALQSRILLVLFDSEEEFVNNEEVMKKSKVGHSTWSEGQKKLIELGLLEKKSNRVMRGKGVCKTVSYRLTDKGRAVALNLARISKMISCQETSEKLDPQTASWGDVQSEIIESIEVALDSFGINLLPLVRDNLEAEGILQWKDVIRDTRRLLAILRDLFGQEGANTIESMIVDNLRSRFASESMKRNDLEDLVEELKHENSARQIQKISHVNAGNT